MKKSPEERAAVSKRCKKEWMENNPEMVAVQRKAWRAKNREHVNIKKREDWEKNKEKYKELRKKAYYKDVEVARERARISYRNNVEKRRAYSKKFREVNPEVTRRQREEHRKNNRESLMWSHTKKSAKEKEVEFNLSREWFKERLTSATCEMSGIEFDMEGKRTPNSPSIDRIDPKGGYTTDNSRMILWSINRALCDYGQEYILGVFKKVLDNK